jgi:endonuclease/exonuclease/phosphatase family metal-dependent hydrolase
MHVCIVTFNVWNIEGEPGRLKAINSELRRLDPDLVAFQEVVQTADVKSLDTLLEGMDLQRTHQTDVQHFIPPFADRYGGSAARSGNAVAASGRRGARPAIAGGVGRSLGDWRS